MSHARIELKVAASIVNYHSASLTQRLANQLLEAGLDYIVIVDNSESPDEYFRLVQSLDSPNVTLIRTKKNMGFGAGQNLAAHHIRQHTNATHVWMINPDVELLDFSFRELVAAATHFPEAVISPLILSPGAVRSIWFAGGKIDRTTARVSHTSFGTTLDRNLTSATFETQFMTGAAPLIPMTVTQIIPFDETLFLYWEDVAFSLRCQEQSIPLLVAPNSLVIHHEGGSSRDVNTAGTSATHYFWTARNRVVVGVREFGWSSILLRGLPRTLWTMLRPIAAKNLNLREKLSGIQGVFEGIIVSWKD